MAWWLKPFTRGPDSQNSSKCQVSMGDPPVIPALKAEPDPWSNQLYRQVLGLIKDPGSKRMKWKTDRGRFHNIHEKRQT